MAKTAMSALYGKPVVYAGYNMVECRAPSCRNYRTPIQKAIDEVGAAARTAIDEILSDMAKTQRPVYVLTAVAICAETHRAGRMLWKLACSHGFSVRCPKYTPPTAPPAIYQYGWAPGVGPASLPIIDLGDDDDDA